MTFGDFVRVSFDAIRDVFRKFRKLLFTADRPTGRYFLVDATVADLEAALGRQSYAPNWEFSYYERGEILNLACVVYDERTVDGTRYRWWQTHVRGWDHERGIALHGHWELEPTETDAAHLDGVGFDFKEGMANLEAALDDAGIEAEEITIGDPDSGH